jgi:hypothetical protein
MSLPQLQNFMKRDPEARSTGSTEISSISEMRSRVGAPRPMVRSLTSNGGDLSKRSKLLNRGAMCRGAALDALMM